MEVEQRYAIRFFVEEDLKGLEIMNSLNKHYGQVPFRERKCMTGSRRWDPGERICQTGRYREGGRMRDWRAALGRQSIGILIFQR
jgi:hypothetical protein